jgi:hypothetical protein
MLNKCFTDQRATLVALVQTVADLRDLAGVMLLQANEVRDGWRRVSPQLLGSCSSRCTACVRTRPVWSSSSRRAGVE